MLGSVPLAPKPRSHPPYWFACGGMPSMLHGVWPCRAHTAVCHPGCFHPSLSPVRGCPRTASSCDNHEPGMEQGTCQLRNLLQAVCSLLEDTWEQASCSSHKISICSQHQAVVSFNSSPGSGNTGIATTSGGMETEKVPDCVPGVLSILPILLCWCSMPCPQDPAPDRGQNSDSSCISSSSQLSLPPGSSASLTTWALTMSHLRNNSQPEAASGMELCPGWSSHHLAEPLGLQGQQEPTASTSLGQHCLLGSTSAGNRQKSPSPPEQQRLQSYQRARSTECTCT